MLSSSFWSVFFAASAHAKVSCYPAGPIVPAPRNLKVAGSTIFSEAVNTLSKAYDDAVSGCLDVQWPVDNVSFSVAVVSLGQTDAHTPIWEYHHLAKGNTRGTQNLDRNSQWLIGSISKVFTDYLMLRTGIDMDKFVVEFLPELRNMSSKIPWNDVTLKMLGSHMAGVTADCKLLLTYLDGTLALMSDGHSWQWSPVFMLTVLRVYIDGFSDYYILKDVFTSLGFPPLNDSEYPSCGVLGLNGGCSTQGRLANH